MARLTMTALTNETRGSRFFEFHTGDHFNFAGAYTFDVDDDAFGTADAWAELDEAMFAVGNRQRLDANGNGWPSFVRSLSVGDVVLVGAPDSFDANGGWAVAHAVENFGFRAHPVAMTVGEDGIVLTVRPR